MGKRGNDLYKTGKHITEHVKRHLVYSNEHDAVVKLSYDPIFPGVVLYSYSNEKKGDTLVPELSATMGVQNPDEKVIVFTNSTHMEMASNRIWRRLLEGE